MKAYINHAEVAEEKRRFENGQELIWDSGAGFDVVTYKGESKVLAGKMADCTLKTGELKGKIIPIDHTQLEEFSLPRWAEMRKRYNNVG